MKKIILICALLGTFAITSCKKEDTAAGEIFGRWLLTDQYADPGDGSGKYQKVTGNPKTITFHQNGEITGEFFEPNTKFKVLDSVQLEISSGDTNKPIIYRYQVNSKHLLLNPPCIEGCGSLFERLD